MTTPTSPPKAVEQARKLVESDEVLLVFNPLGTPSNTAIQKYMNSKKVPQLFVATGATKWSDPKNFPWTMGWQPNYQSEAQIYAKWLMKEKPDAKIAILYQNDDFGKDYLKGLKDGLGAKAASMIIMEESYEVSEPTINSQIVRLKAAGPDVLLINTTPKFAAQAIKKIAELGWKPLHILNNVSASVGSVMQPAGFENAQGMLSAAYVKDATDPQWNNDPGMKKWAAFMDKYMPGRRQDRRRLVYGYGAGADPGAGAGEVRRRSHPRQRHEAGREPEGLRARHAAARHQDQHQRHRLLPDRADADAAVQGREVGTVRRDHQRRRSHRVSCAAVRASNGNEISPLRHQSRGLFVDGMRRNVFNARAARTLHERNRNLGDELLSALRLAAFRPRSPCSRATGGSALAQKKYDTGATDTEIKIGNIMPYSGPASAYGVIGKTEEAYFRKINAEGGINGRKIKFISYDDAYCPPKAVEQVRKLVESDEVLLVFNPLGTPSNTAIQKYMNAKKVPQLFVATGATKWNDPKNFPWTMGWQPSYQSEAHIYAKYLMKEKPGRQDRRALPERRLRQGLSEGPEGRARRKGVDDRRRGKLRDLGADHRLPHRQAQGRRRRHLHQHHHAEIRRAGDQENRRARLEAAAHRRQRFGLGRRRDEAGRLRESRKGMLSAAYAKDGADPQWDNDPGMKKCIAFLDEVLSRKATRPTAAVVYGYGAAQTLVKVLEMCGDDLTRANVMKQAASLKDFAPDTLLPGITINTSPTDFAPIEQLQMMRFKGEKWELFGES